jgi:hypothetical protein
MGSITTMDEVAMHLPFLMATGETST